MSIERRFKEERARSCLRKRRYKSESEAFYQAGAVARRSGNEMSTYRCNWCRGWHLTSKKEEAPDV